MEQRHERRVCRSSRLQLTRHKFEVRRVYSKIKTTAIACGKTHSMRWGRAPEICGTVAREADRVERAYVSAEPGIGPAVCGARGCAWCVGGVGLRAWGRRPWRGKGRGEGEGVRRGVGGGVGKARAQPVRALPPPCPPRRPLQQAAAADPLAQGTSLLVIRGLNYLLHRPHTRTTTPPPARPPDSYKTRSSARR